MKKYAVFALFFIFMLIFNNVSFAQQNKDTVPLVEKEIENLKKLFLQQQEMYNNLAKEHLELKKKNAELEAKLRRIETTSSTQYSENSYTPIEAGINERINTLKEYIDQIYGRPIEGASRYSHYDDYSLLGIESRVVKLEKEFQELISKIRDMENNRR